MYICITLLLKQTKDTMKKLPIYLMLAASIIACQSPQQAEETSLFNPYDPMLDGQCQVQQVDKGESWPSTYMWHPGQLAAWKQADNLARSKGRCVYVGYPGSYYKMSETTLFQTEAELNKNSVLEWRASGDVQLKLDDIIQEIKGNQFEIPAGKHSLQILVTSKGRVPALIVKGAGLEDANRWTSSTDGNNWVPVESDARFCHPQILPDEPQEVLVTIPHQGDITLKAGEQQLVDFKHLELGFVKMHIKGNARLAFVVGETPEEAQNTEIRGFEQFALDTLVVEGEQDFTLKERALRYLSISALEGECTISQLRFDAEMWPVEFQMDFECDDEELNQIFQASIATLHTCMHNFYLDGVKRDFLPWAMDAVVSSMGADFAFGEQQLSRNGISIALMPENPTQADLGVIDYPLHALLGLQQEYMRYGELKTSLMFQHRIISQMELFMSMQDENGFITAIDNGWGFIPGWDIQNGPEHPGRAAYPQMLLMENFRIGANFAKLWNMPELAETYTQKAEQLEKGIKEHFWDPDRKVFINGYLLDGTRDERVSHHTQYWSVLTGLYPAEEYKHLFEEVYPSIPNYLDNISYEKGYEAMAYAKAGYAPQFIDVLKKVWGYWLKKGNTRFPENFQINESEATQREFYHRPFGLSLCHGANGAPAVTTIIYGLFGFQQDMEHPGEYTVSPKLYNLKHMKGYFTVKEGRISIQVKEDGTVQVDAPENCTVKVL